MCRIQTGKKGGWWLPWAEVSRMESKEARMTGAEILAGSWWEGEETAGWRENPVTQCEGLDHRAKVSITAG